MAVWYARIVNQKHKILYGEKVWRIEAHHHAKFSRKLSIHSGDVTIFRIFKMAAAAILDFWNREIWLAIRVKGVEMHEHAKFSQNRSISKKILWFFDFSRWRPSTILGLFGANLDYPQWVLGVSITLQNLVMINALVFIIWTFQYLPRLAKKCLFTPPKLFFGQFDPLNGLQYQPKPKKHTLAWVRVIWAIKRKNMVSGLTCRWVALKGGKNKKMVIFHLFVQKHLMDGFPPNFAQV